MSASNASVQIEGRWIALALVCAGVVLSMTTWFSAAAILPALADHWSLTSTQTSWLTTMVQIGFVVGALSASITGLPDIMSLRLLMGTSALVAAAANLSLLWMPSAGPALFARFITGVALAGVYPSAMKLVSTWFVKNRGTALGAVIGALTLGSASPHLIRVLASHIDWTWVVIIASILTACGAVVLGGLTREGPFPFARSSFDLHKLRQVVTDRPLLLANVGYFGHMWELYAMWGWFLAFASVALPKLGLNTPLAASLVTFGVVSSGVIGAVAGGVLADRIGRTATAALMMTVSGFCAVAMGAAFAGPLWLFLAIAFVWGIAVIGDSAQFSAMATELVDGSNVGTALAFQLGVGFAVTVVSIQIIPIIAAAVGWQWTFLFLAPGPLVGICAMVLLRRHPDARKIAHGLM